MLKEKYKVKDEYFQWLVKNDFPQIDMLELLAITIDEDEPCENDEDMLEMVNNCGFVMNRVHINELVNFILSYNAAK